MIDCYTSKKVLRLTHTLIHYERPSERGTQLKALSIDNKILRKKLFEPPTGQIRLT